MGVGVLRESTSAEMPCMDSNAAEEEEEEWKDWDDWEDWGECEDDKEDATSNQSSEKSATLSSNNVQNDEIRKIIQVSSKPRARHGQVGEGEGGWLESVVHIIA